MQSPRQQINDNIAVSAHEIVGSPFCVATDDGDRVFRHIEHALRSGTSIVLSFKNVVALTPAFLNAALGRLYGKFSEEEICAGLSLLDIEPDDLALLNDVVENAKTYFKDPSGYAEAARTALEQVEDV